MPYLKKPNKQPSRTFNREERQKIYQSTKWKELRLAKLMQQPLCELCLKEDKVVLAVDVHHITSFMSTTDHLKSRSLAYNPKNLMSLCKKCHQNIHNSIRL